MGRPKADIDEARVAELALDGARNSEIAAILDIDAKTVENRFSRLLTKKRAERKIDIRKYQMEQAKAGNPAMLIWLGKNELDQTDKATLQVGMSASVNVMAKADEIRKRRAGGK
jgi:DNA-binding CsgD family transcriptional regulator